MSKLFCGDCMCIIDKPYRWADPHGESMNGCGCGNGLIEIEACALCGTYPREQYEEGELPNGGICEECFERGIQNHFMEYLNSLDNDEQAEFYCGKVEGGYAYDSLDVLLTMKAAYAEHVKLYCRHIFSVERETTIWKKFINDGDPWHFAEFLIGKNKGQSYVAV